jgi:dTMP kinase
VSKKALFIVIEGLDGSGKTTVARQLTYFLQSVLHKKVKLSFEPHDASCGGLFIRQVLEKKITTFSHETLALAFAANRRDHGDRVIHQWLKEGEDKVVICDRYYLSSLVYQSTAQFSMDDVMRLNQNARKPDLIFFMNVRNEVVRQRMDIRNKPKELFEENLTQTRDKFLKGITYLREKRHEKIIEIDANGSISSALAQMGEAIFHFHPDWQDERLLRAADFELREAYPFFPNNNTTSTGLLAPLSRSAQLPTDLEALFQKLSYSEKASLFLERLAAMGYTLGGSVPGISSTAFALNYSLPGDLQQRGVALLLEEEQRYDGVTNCIREVQPLCDFIFVFAPGPSDAVTTYFSRESIVTMEAENRLSPNVGWVTEGDLCDWLLGLLSS